MFLKWKSLFSETVLHTDYSLQSAEFYFFVQTMDHQLKIYIYILIEFQKEKNGNYPQKLITNSWTDLRSLSDIWGGKVLPPKDEQDQHKGYVTDSMKAKSGKAFQISRIWWLYELKKLWGNLCENVSTELGSEVWSNESYLLQVTDITNWQIYWKRSLLKKRFPFFSKLHFSENLNLQQWKVYNFIAVIEKSLTQS